MRSSLQEPGLDSHPIFLGILYLATTNLETYLIYNHSVVKDCNSQSVYASTKQMSKSLVTINPPNKPSSCSLLAEIPDLTIAQVANPYVSIFLTHITMSNHLTLFAATSYRTLLGLFLCSHCLIINLHVSSF